jgi:hypothetical protein
MPLTTTITVIDKSLHIYGAPEGCYCIAVSFVDGDNYIAFCDFHDDTDFSWCYVDGYCPEMKTASLTDPGDEIITHPIYNLSWVKCNPGKNLLVFLKSV